MSSQWYALQILPQLRETAEFHLKRQGFEFFYPLCKLHRSRSTLYRHKLSGKPIDEFEPMFIGYGFVRFDLSRDQWLSINGTRGVIGLLPKPRGDVLTYPEPMGYGIVERLIADGPKDLSGPTALLELQELLVGMTVEVVEGLMKTYRGRISAVRGKMLEVYLYQKAGESKRGVWIHKREVVEVADESID
jgi:transcription antitermination factor NusG